MDWVYLIAMLVGHYCIYMIGRRHGSLSAYRDVYGGKFIECDINAIEDETTYNGKQGKFYFQYTPYAPLIMRKLQKYLRDKSKEQTK